MIKKIKRFNESVFPQVQLNFPKKLSIYSSNGNFDYELQDSYNDGSLIKGTYTKFVDKFKDSPLSIDEPNNLYLELNYHNNEEGDKFFVRVTYGTSEKFEFTIRRPNIVVVTSYNGFGSKFDSESKFALSNKSIEDFVDSLNQIGFELTTKHFEFMDKNPYSYQHYESFRLSPLFGGIILVINNGEPNRRGYLSNVLKYLVSRGVNYKVTSSITEIDTIKNTENIFGVILTGSDYRITNPNNDSEQELSHKILREINKPIIGLCYGFQSMAYFHGSRVKDSGEYLNDNICLSNWNKDSLIFKNIDLDDFQLSISFHDVVTDCPKDFNIIAEFNDYIMGIESKKLMRWGLAFHPEDIERTYPILDNFIDVCRDHSTSVDKILKFEDF